jgi:hypothetical protein
MARFASRLAGAMAEGLMLAGHFGLAAIVKSKETAVPLWALMLATQWLDVVFVPLFIVGIETIDPVDPANPNAYGGGIIHADYTHSLLGALVLSAIVGGFGRWRWGARPGWILAGVAFSHWLLDLLVHRMDLPILPGNAGNLPLLGFGIWRAPILAGVLEAALVLAGAFLYYRSASELTAPPGRSAGEQRRRVVTASAVVGGLMIFLLVTSFLGIG